MTTNKDSPEEGFRSGFEKSVAAWLSKNIIPFEYEPCKIKYKVPETLHSYTPDWRIGGVGHIFYESKGYFKAADRKKMLYVRECNPKITLRIIFMNSKITISKKSKTTYADWATKNGFDYFCWKSGKDFKSWIAG